MSIRRIYVCDRCGAESPALDTNIINRNIPRCWGKVTTFINVRDVKYPFARIKVFHLCGGCSKLHEEWLKPTHPPGMVIFTDHVGG